MARSAGHPIPVGLARRSRRVLAAAVVAATALVVPVAISGADGPKPPPPPKVEVVKSPDELAHKQAQLDQQVQQSGGQISEPGLTGLGQRAEEAEDLGQLLQDNHAPPVVLQAGRVAR